MKIIIGIVFLTVARGIPINKFHDPMNNDGLFEGDIVGIDPYSDRNAVPTDSQRWPGGIIPYEIDERMEKDMADRILKAMKEIMENSCIRFVQRTSEDKHYLSIIKQSGCWSFWGFLGNGKQPLSLGSGCEPHGTILHVLMHAVGFEHEHIRSDRDEYLNILWENIDEHTAKNFRKLRPEENRLLTDFDFDSVMLYGPYALGKGFKRVKVMEAKDGRFMPEVYEKKGLSPTDIKRINILYECEKV